MRLHPRLAPASIFIFGLLGCDATSDHPANLGGAAGRGGNAMGGSSGIDRWDSGPGWDGSSGAEEAGPWNGPVGWVDDDDVTCGGHSPCFSDLASAASTAPKASTLIVREGSYGGVDLRDKVIRIMSESGPGATTLGGDSRTQSCIVANDSTVWISGFTMRDCGYRGSTISEGYAVFLGGSNFVHAHIEGNVIEQNQQGGIYLHSGSVGLRAEIQIVGNRITRNLGPDGGISIGLLPSLPNHGLVLLANNVIASNSWAIKFSPDIVGPTSNPFPDLRFQIVNNTVASNQRGIDASTSNVTLANNIFFGNTLNEINRFWTVPSNRAFNNIIGDGQSLGIDGNFLADPLFVDPKSGDYHLLGGSPAANRATSQFAPTNDFDGFPRTGLPDVGAFELVDRVDEPPIRCGDSVVSSGAVTWLGTERIGYESCDDGNIVAGDGCNDLCQWEARVLGPTGRPGLIGASDKNVCVLRMDESVRCWGTGLGPTPAGQYLAVAAANTYACAIRKGDGSLACWNIAYATLPVPSGSYKHLVATGNTTCALDDAGNVTCWTVGSNSAPIRFPGPFIDIAQGGVCGIGVAGDVTWYGTTNAPADSFVQVVGGGSTGCGLHADGSTVCWAPAGLLPPRFPLGSFVRFSYGQNLSVPWCALRPHGGMSCWSSKDALQNSPQKGFIDIAPNGLPCGLTADRRVNCWGLTGSEYPHE